MTMSNIWAILKKQLKDTLKNKTILIQFIMFPTLTLIMNNAIKINGMPENFFVTLFATMYVGMAPLTAMTAIIAEEKEKNTLRVLLLSNVKPYEYFSGVGIYVWVSCLIGAAVICAAGNYERNESIFFMLVMAIGILASLMIGAAIGTWSRTQMAATSITVPVMMILSFLPMLSIFNTSIAKIAKFFYSEQIHLMLNQINNLKIEFHSFCIVFLNMIVAAVLFHIAYRKCGLA